MGVNDGYVGGLTKVLSNGPSSMRFNFVLVAEGFRDSEWPQFHQEVDKFINKLLNTSPFDDLSYALNVYYLDVHSNESGADEPSGGECTGSGDMRATYFDATFCSAGIQRLLSVDASLVLSTVGSKLPDYDAVIVMVNSTTYGGSGGGVATYSLGVSPITGKGGVEIAIHELGHVPFGLADEYAYDGDKQSYGGPEPSAVNITANADKNTIKWNDLIAPDTDVPTMENPDCTQEDMSPSPVPVGTVGAFEGAGHWHCGLYRPEFNCQMRALANPFCAVCQRAIREALEPYTKPWVDSGKPHPKRHETADAMLAVDPMYLILSGKAYRIWVDWHHPHEPKSEEIRAALQELTPEERKLALGRARILKEYAKSVEEAIAGSS